MRWLAQPHSADEDFGARAPRRLSKARERGAKRSAVDIPSITIPAPHRAARLAAVVEAAALSTGTGNSARRARECGIAGQVTETLTAEHGDEARGARP